MNDKHLRIWFVVFVIAVFMGGVGGGMILDRYVGPLPEAARMPGRRAFGPASSPAPAPAMVMRRLVRDLNLTPEQQTQLDQIFADRRKRIEQIQGEVQARFDSEQRDLRAAIEKILTPEQRKRFQDWLAREPMPGIRRGPGRGLGGPGRGLGPGRGMGPGGGMGRGPGGF
jgi:hypothetical protein